MFITNNETAKADLAKRLETLAMCSRQLDMLVGFFYFSGIRVLADALRRHPYLRWRVLVGMEADPVSGGLVEAALDRQERRPDSDLDVRNRFYDSMRRIVGAEKADNRAFHEQRDLMVELLKTGRLEIRKTREPNHAKLYIFWMQEGFDKLRDKFWITGSSNFSEYGLVLRNELNVEICDFGADEAEGYFQRLWDDAVPLTADEAQRKALVDILQDSSVAASVTPFEAYFLIMRNYLEHQQSRLLEARMDKILSKAGFRKYRYQADAVVQAFEKLDQYRGVIIADVVGLGKSVIAGLIGAMRRKRGIIICPPSLIGARQGTSGGWYEYKTRFNLVGWEIWSRGDMKGLRELLRNDPDFDMVIVDEAHNFRNERTCDYACLSDICFGKEVVLLTATPFNNKPSDLLALLHLFSNGRQSPFVAGGNLDGRFKSFSRRYEAVADLHKAIARRSVKNAVRALKACGAPLPAGADIVWSDAEWAAARREAGKHGRAVTQGIRQILEKVAIRRNRLDLLSDPDYAPEISSLSTVRPPVQQFFELSPEQDAFYDRVITEYFGTDGLFRGAVYHPDAYCLQDERKSDAYQKNIYNFVLHQLILRFESSFGAFRQSLVNTKKMMEMSRAFIDSMGCYLYSRKDMENLLTIEDGFEVFTALAETVDRLEKEYRESGKRGRADRPIVYTMSDPGFNGDGFKKDIDSDIELLGKVIGEVDALRLSSHDPKCARLTEAIAQILRGAHPDIAPEPGSPTRKVLLFTAYTDTVRYVQGIVEKAFPGRVLAVDGANFTQEKANLVRENFDAAIGQQADDYDILLTTDKLSEGVNLHRAGVIFNYDIPWNPTRVIQRVGRINRIGRKVFENLYIFNFFPTRRGAAINQNREIAQGKMFAIHEILGEDARIFSSEEEPTAAALYTKLSAGPDSEPAGFYAELKKKYAAAKKFLEENHPGALERIARLPGMVKTAFRGDAPCGIYQFRRQGPGFFALACPGDGGPVIELPLEEAVRAVECPYGTERAPFRASFWSHGRRRDGGAEIPGDYQALKGYAPPDPAPAHGGGALPDTVRATQNISDALPGLPPPLRDFARDVMTDLQSYATIPAYTVRRLANLPADPADAAGRIRDVLAEIRDIRGEDYLDRVKAEAAHGDIIVTIDKQSRREEK